MHFNIYIDDDLGKQLNVFAKRTKSTRNSLIRRALEEFIKHKARGGWSDEILNFTGIKDFTPFELHRKDLVPPNKDPFA